MVRDDGFVCLVLEMDFDFDYSERSSGSKYDF